MQTHLARLADELADIHEQDQFRVLRPPYGHDFCSNDYLGLSKHPHLIAAIKSTLEQEGYGSSSSRYIRGERMSYRALEDRLARFKKAKKALLFSSGYIANIGALGALIKKGDIVYSDQLNHASIIDGIKISGATVQIFPHLDVDALTTLIANAPRKSTKFLVTESLFSMDGDIAPLDRYAELARVFDIALIVDEAHAVGLYGDHGAGLIDHFGVSDQVLISINGLGKAFGCYGAFAAGSETAVEYLCQRARSLMFTTALPPLALSAIDAALDIVIDAQDARKTLFDNARYLAGHLGHFSELSSPIIPYILGDNTRTKLIAEQLLNHGFDTKAIRPPTVPKKQARLRITTTINHSRALLDEFAQCLKSLL